MNEADKKLDLICIGRAGVDLYADQIGSRLPDVDSFSKYIGGSSTNIAACSSRMGLRTALVTRVGNEHMGDFIREQLAREGVDTSHVITDPDRLTALVILGIKDKDTFPLIFYRENCADMAISKDDFDASFIASAKTLLITGTHFSSNSVYETCTHALDLARAAGVQTVLDIDYRPVLWGLTTKGDGETRFVASDNVTAHLQTILGKFDLIVGTEEEMAIAGGSTDSLQALRNIRVKTDAVLVLKRGPYGASVYAGEIPEHLDQGITVQGVSVDVLNVLGAGDAFISGFLRGWINNEGFEQALTYANACGALVVSRHGCTPAMPTQPELDYYLGHADKIARPDTDTELNYLHRVSTRNATPPELAIFAFDHRSQFVTMARDAGVAEQEVGNKIEQLKTFLYEAVCLVNNEGIAESAMGILCDGTYGQNVLNQASGRGLWIGRPVEEPGSRPLQFEGGRSVGTILASWPTEQIVKCLVFYRSSDEEGLRALQEQRLRELYDACCHSGHELLLEIIPPKEKTGSNTESDGESIFNSINRVLDIGIRPDWWKLPAVESDWAERICNSIESRLPWCRGILVLGLDAPVEELKVAFKGFAKHDLVKGFAVGRTVFRQPSEQWLRGEMNNNQLQQAVAENYRNLTNMWHLARQQARHQSHQPVRQTETGPS